MRLVVHRLHRVADQIEQDLLDLHAIDQDVVVRGDLDRQVDRLAAGADEGQRARLVDQPASETTCRSVSPREI